MRNLAAVVILLALMLAGSALKVQHGFTATYFSNDTFTPPHERGTELRAEHATRVDDVLAFGGPARRDWPLYFFNDHTRFNFYRPGQPQRSQLGFSVVWDGFLLVEEGLREQEMYLRGSGAEAELLLDGMTILRLPAGDEVVSGPAFVPKGWRHIRVRARVPYGAVRDFEAGSTDPATGVRKPFAADQVYRAPASRGRLRVDAAARLVSDVLQVLLIAMLIWTAGRWAIRRGRAAEALAWTLAIADAWRHARPWAGRLILLPGGDDSLTYESQARDILLNGPLMLLGNLPGQAEAFYYQPLYGYVLAVIHGLFGPDMFGVYLVQRLLLFATLICVWKITERLFGDVAGRMSLVAGGLFLYTRPEWEMAIWGENVFVPLVALWTLWLMAMASPGAGNRAATLAGVAGGLAILSRSTLMLAVIPVALLVIWVRRNRRETLTPVATMLCVMAMVVSLATARNWIASGTFVPITTSFSINLYLGNTPPQGVPVHATADHALYEWFAAEDTTRMSVEFARHAPAEFLKNLGRKLLYAGGVFEPLVPGAGYSPTLMLIIAMSALGGAIVARGGAPHGQTGPARWIPFAIAASLFAAVTLIFPTHARLILPSYVPLLPYAAVAGAFLIHPVFGRRT